MRTQVLGEPQGLLFMVVGPPGVGKNTLMNDALRHFDNLRQLPTVTTRERRSNEQEGREHIFVSPETFQHMIAEGQLFEWQEVHPGKFYGVPRSSMEPVLSKGANRIADIDVLGATYIRSVFPANVVLIFIKPPSIEVLKHRMEIRREKDISTRLTRVAMELSFAPVADHIVINDDFKTAAQQFRAVINSEMQRQQLGHPPEYHYTTDVVTIPIYGQEALFRQTPPHFPTLPVTDPQIPHEVALSAIQDTLSISPSQDLLVRRKPNQGSFISPVHVSVIEKDQTKHITFTYAYLLPERTPPGSDWRWRPIDDLALAEDIQRRLEIHQQVSPQET